MTALFPDKMVLPATLSALLLVLLAGCDQAPPQPPISTSWTRHTIDDRFRGADGVKLGDVTGDGLTDLVVAWEESGVVVVYLNPGPDRATGRWPSVVVGRVPDVEDAVFVDLDGDGVFDVVSCCQGRTRTMFVHWAPRDPAAYTDPDAWRTEPLPATVGLCQWMFCEPAQIDGMHGVDLVAGGKGDGAQIGYLAAPADPRDLAAWTWRPLASASWIMSIIPVDIDGDGNIDILYTDRKGGARGVYWLENPGNPLMPWPRHLIATSDHELMFADLGDLNLDGRPDLIVATDRRQLLHLRPPADPRLPWLSVPIPLPSFYGTGKGVRLGDISLDGAPDIVFSCENAGGKYGVGWLRQQSIGELTFWNAWPVSDTAGSKFDLVQLVDLDGDGDLDVITTEESAGLGVVWYENPALP